MPHLDDIGGANLEPGATRNPHLPVGKFICRIDSITLKATFEHGDAYIVDGTVMESSDPSVAPGAAVCLWYRGMQKRKYALDAIEHFIYATLGYDLTRDKARILSEALPALAAWTAASFDSRQAFKGKFVGVTKSPGKTKPDGTPGYPRELFTPASSSPPGPLPALAPPPSAPYPGVGTPPSPPYAVPADPAKAQYDAWVAAKSAVAAPVDPAFEEWKRSQGRSQ